MSAEYTIKDLNFKVNSSDFYSYLSAFLKDISNNSINNSKDAVLEFNCTDIMRDKECNFTIEFHFGKKDTYEYFDLLKIYSAEDSINEYDLKEYTNKIILRLFAELNNKTKTKYVVRNYCSYFNAFPMKINLVVQGDHKTRLRSYDFNSKNLRPPLTEQILFFDNEVEAVNSFLMNTTPIYKRMSIFVFKKKFKDYTRFNVLIRKCIVGWIYGNILGKVDLESGE